jgi:hypothetical protein
VTTDGKHLLMSTDKFPEFLQELVPLASGGFYLQNMQATLEFSKDESNHVVDLLLKFGLITLTAPRINLQASAPLSQLTDSPSH